MLKIKIIGINKALIPVNDKFSLYEKIYSAVLQICQLSVIFKVTLITVEAKMARARKTIVGIVMEQLRKEIATGQYPPGTFLPPERKLAEDFGVSKSTVHNMLIQLQREGIVAISPGKGALVVNEKRHGALNRFFVRPSGSGYYGGRSSVDMMLGGIFKGAEKYKAEVVLNFSDDAKLTERLISLYSKGEIQGIVYIQCASYELVEPLEKAGVPYVIAQQEFPFSAVSIGIDFREAVRMMVRRLVASGHRKIGILLGQLEGYASHIYKEFAAGFRGALAEEMLEYNPRWCLDGISDSAGMEKIKNLLKSKESLPTAFVSTRDYRARFFYESCDKLNLRIPEDISIISFDDNTWKNAKENNLTTFVEPVRFMGETAVDMLQAWISSGERPESKVIVPEIAERGSIAVING